MVLYWSATTDAGTTMGYRQIKPCCWCCCLKLCKMILFLFMLTIRFIKRSVSPLKVPSYSETGMVVKEQPQLSKLPRVLLKFLILPVNQALLGPYLCQYQTTNTADYSAAVSALVLIGIRKNETYLLSSSSVLTSVSTTCSCHLQEPGYHCYYHRRIHAHLSLYCWHYHHRCPLSRAQTSPIHSFR